jgi:RNA polymerase sigma-70 factor (sigma-E family)
MTDYTGFNRLLRDRSPAMLRTAFLFTGDHYLAEDLLQAALTKTYLRWGNLRDERAGEAYVRKVMASVYTRWYRRKWNAEYPTLDLPERGALDPYPASDDRIVVSELLRSLSRRQRAVVVLRFFEDLSEKDVADMLGISVGTVKSTTAAALAKLRASTSSERPPLRPGGREEVGNA